ncbi:disease resistance protein RUN1-like [Lotus japonicus]|uniref:disease resistance protein RUN1-like n=1 Tax=Lotus japonicus TaxID=34305 RepID=UPI0025865AFF|nr:disease resistance protein RUN1-like [Lotus japonicus]
MECRKHQAQVVILVFYETDPSCVRKQRGSYEVAFANHEQDLTDDDSDQDKLHRWRTAPTQAANISGWDARTLLKLEKYPNEKILNVLKVSYDGLHNPTKEIFLDIAFFFKNKDKHMAVGILDACDFFAASGIDVLVDKALITFSYNNNIQMHDLLQEMGLDIVRKECLKNPGTRSRLRDNEVYDVLKNNRGADTIEGITLDLSQVVDLQLSSNTFKKMLNLRLLRLYVPEESIDLSEGKQLLKLLDLSKASKLKEVDLSGCESFPDVHPSILSLKTLE